MRYVIVGAGAVGGTIGARLFQGGHEVLLVARGAHLAELRSLGLQLITPAGTVTQRIPAVAGPDEAGPLRPDDILILTVKSQDTAAALAQWVAAPVAGGGEVGDLIPVVCAQNGVENERMAQRVFRTVYGLCVWLPATHLEPGVVVAQAAPRSGILTLGRYPHGVDPVAEEIGAALRDSMFDAYVVPDVMRWKYGKLLKNLGNALDAVLDKAHPDAPALLAEVGAAANAEGERVLNTAGIAFNSDDERRALQRDRMELQTIEGVGRGGGSTWQSLARGAGSVEGDYLNGEISLLGRLHGVPTPVNDLLQRLVAEFAREGRSPGGLSPDGLRALLV